MRPKAYTIADNQTIRAVFDEYTIQGSILVKILTPTFEYQPSYIHTRTLQYKLLHTLIRLVQWGKSCTAIQIHSSNSKKND